MDKIPLKQIGKQLRIFHGELDQTLSLEPIVETIVDIVETGADNPDFEQHWCLA